MWFVVTTVGFMLVAGWDSYILDHDLDYTEQVSIQNNWTKEIVARRGDDISISYKTAVRLEDGRVYSLMAEYGIPNGVAVLLHQRSKIFKFRIMQLCPQASNTCYRIDQL